MKKISIFILSIILMFSVTPNVKALTFEKTTDKFIASENVKIKKNVLGDLYAAGNTITIRADITGDAIAAASTISLTGNVGHNVRMAANTLTFDKLTAYNMTLAGSDITLIDVEVNKIYAASSSFEFSGIVNNLNVSAKDIIIEGTINENSTINGVNITIKEGTIINKTLTVKSTNKITYEGDVAKTNIKYIKVTDPDTNPNWFGEGGVLYNYLYNAAMLYVMALLISIFFKKFNKKAVDNLKEEKAKPVLFGLLLFIGVPFIGLMALMTVVLIPVVVILAFLYITLIIVSTAFASVTLGGLLFKDKNYYLKILFGVLIVALLLMVPYVGIFVWLVCAGYTFGSFKLFIKK
ncbi:MAG: hypothetical protein PHQ89_00295 [Bacilli bacterium]|nr:hypothetical protein [Bacilli bacterium]